MAEESQLDETPSHSQQRPGSTSKDGTGHPLARSSLSDHQYQQSRAVLRSRKKTPSVRLQKLPVMVLSSLVTTPRKSQLGPTHIKVRVSPAAALRALHGNTTKRPAPTPGPGVEGEPVFEVSARHVDDSPMRIDVRKEMPSSKRVSSRGLRHDHSYSYGSHQGLQPPGAMITKDMSLQITDLRRKLKITQQKMRRARQALERERQMHNETQQTLQALMDSIQFQAVS
ncbi:uncharacterized protein [Diadema antillarum]|uniref:uncharacterized protein n=1 Tax=Diadema antillarum TaxID=105358 RepID=UPI003A88AF2C